MGGIGRSRGEAAGNSLREEGTGLGGPVGDTGDRQGIGRSQTLQCLWAASVLGLCPKSNGRPLERDRIPRANFKRSLCGEQTRREQERTQGDQSGGTKPRAKPSLRHTEERGPLLHTPHPPQVSYVTTSKEPTVL